MKTLNIIILLILFVSPFYAQEKRDLSNYVAGPTFEDHDSRFPNDEENFVIIFQELRDYLWDAWNKKTMTYFSLDTFTLEGHKASLIFYVEKNKNGFWQVVLKNDCENDTIFGSKKVCEKVYVNEKSFRLLLTNTESNKSIKY